MLDTINLILSIVNQVDSSAREWNLQYMASFFFCTILFVDFEVLEVASCTLFDLVVKILLDTGTGNGLAKSVLDHVGEPCDAASATFLVIRGNLIYFLT